jgi:predicted nucleotidyltransferase
MKPIKKSIEEINSLLNRFSRERNYTDLVVAVIGGIAVIAHGVERTTSDIDLLIHAEPSEGLIDDLARFFTEHGHRNIKVHKAAARGSTDPLQHDIMLLQEDRRIDFLVARYQWELEGLKEAAGGKPVYQGTTVYLFPKPYLLAMKLKAGGPKDDADVFYLYPLLNNKERAKAEELTDIIRRKNRLKALLRRYKKASQS